MKKLLRNLCIILVILFLFVFSLFINDIRTINSIKLIDDYGLYYMDYYSDYGLDKLIEQGGANSDDEIVAFTINQVLKGLPVEFDIPDFGCTTFQVQTENQEWIFGRNYDLDYVPSMIIKTTPKNGYDSVAVANMSIMGYNQENKPDNFINSIISLATPYTVMDGLNEKGLSIAVLIVKDTPTKQTQHDIGMTTTSAIRYILDKAPDVETAINLFENMNMNDSSGTSYHYQIADSSGNSAIIEYIDNNISVIKKEENTPMLLTNFIISEEKYGFGKGHDRYYTALNIIENSNGIMSMSEAMNLLEKVQMSDYDPILDDGSDTQWSVVYNNTNLSMDICVGGNFENIYTFYPFE